MITARTRLKEAFEKLGIQPKKSLGQNFLINDHVIEKMLSEAWNGPIGSLLEIGPGPGALTDLLKQKVEREKIPYQVVELDHQLAQYWREQGLNVVEVDALQWHWQKEFFANELMLEPRVLISNLPYQISSSLVIDRSLDAAPLSRMILMFQKEVAQRIRAQKQTEFYGMLSVIAQTFWQIETVCDVSPGDFLPPPNVASRVLVFRHKPSSVVDKKKYLKFVKACFLHPRKLLASNLEQGYACTKEKAMALLVEQGFSEKVRAQELSVTQFIDFFHKLG